MIQATARAFAMKELLPLANKLRPEKADMPRARIGKTGTTCGSMSACHPRQVPAGWAGRLRILPESTEGAVAAP